MNMNIGLNLRRHLPTMMWLMDPDQRGSGRTFLQVFSCIVLARSKIARSINLPPQINSYEDARFRDNVFNVMTQLGIKYTYGKDNFEITSSPYIDTIDDLDFDMEAFKSTVMDLLNKGTNSEDLIKCIQDSFILKIMND